MEPLLLKHGTLLELDPPSAEVADLRLDAGRIVERGSNLQNQLGERHVDLSGLLVLPGLVNGHTHLYSTLARGMPMPSGLTGFRKILEKVWWRLDRALTLDLVYHSARIGAVESLLAGTTTIIDHHASPCAIDGSLDRVADACREVGVRLVTCYEVTDRNGLGGRVEGLRESRRFLARQHEQLAGLNGAHASFTLDDQTLEDLAAIGRETGAGLHIHLAEDACDDGDARERGAPSAAQRLDAAGLLGPTAVLAHGTNLGAEDLALVRERGAWLVHNPRSNMNNQVGYAGWIGDGHGRSALGTDGIGGDMFAEAKQCWFSAQNAHVQGFAPQDVLRLLAGSHRLASGILGLGIGQLQPGAAADLLVLDYPRPTSLNVKNLAAHLVFGLESRHVSSVICGGRVVVERRQTPHLELEVIYAEARKAADQIWTRMEKMAAEEPA